MIVIDDRERASGICTMLESYNIPCEVQRLDIGDYLINDHIFIERKTVVDFIRCLRDQNLFLQVSKLREHGKRGILIIEGPKLPGTPLIKGMLCSLATQWYLPVLRSKDAIGTAWLLNRMYKSEEKQDKPHVVYKQRNACHIASNQIRMLVQIKDIGPRAATKLMEHFGSIQNISNAKEQELLDVPGIGIYLAQKIEEFMCT